MSQVNTPEPLNILEQDTDEGVEDFMNISRAGVTLRAPLALTSKGIRPNIPFYDLSADVDNVDLGVVINFCGEDMVRRILRTALRRFSLDAAQDEQNLTKLPDGRTAINKDSLKEALEALEVVRRTKADLMALLLKANKEFTTLIGKGFTPETIKQLEELRANTQKWSTELASIEEAAAERAAARAASKAGPEL